MSGLLKWVCCAQILLSFRSLTAVWLCSFFHAYHEPVRVRTMLAGQDRYRGKCFEDRPVSRPGAPLICRYFVSVPLTYKLPSAWIQNIYLAPGNKRSWTVLHKLQTIKFGLQDSKYLIPESSALKSASVQGCQLSRPIRSILNRVRLRTHNFRAQRVGPQES
jgi:hypothetical protein